MDRLTLNELTSEIEKYKLQNVVEYFKSEKKIGLFMIDLDATGYYLPADVSHYIINNINNDDFIEKLRNIELSFVSGDIIFLLYNGRVNMYNIKNESSLDRYLKYDIVSIGKFDYTNKNPLYLLFYIEYNDLKNLISNTIKDCDSDLKFTLEKLEDIIIFGDNDVVGNEYSLVTFSDSSCFETQPDKYITYGIIHDILDILNLGCIKNMFVIGQLFYSSLVNVNLDKYNNEDASYICRRINYFYGSSTLDRKNYHRETFLYNSFFYFGISIAPLKICNTTSPYCDKLNPSDKLIRKFSDGHLTNRTIGSELKELLSIIKNDRRYDEFWDRDILFENSKKSYIKGYETQDFTSYNTKSSRNV